MPIDLPALALTDLTIRDRAGLACVAGVSLSLQRGEAALIIGETGSGKSLIAQAIMGLLPDGFSATGQLRLGAGESIPLSDKAALQRLWARDVMFLPQEPGAAFDPTMRIERQMVVAGGHAEPAESLAKVDLPQAVASAYPHTLSGGMAQRVLVATALSNNAPVVIADEPTKGLDSDRIGHVRALFETILAHGRALIVITHDIALLRALPGMVVVLKDGQVIESSASANLLSEPSADYTRAWLKADPSDWDYCRRCHDMDDLVLAGHDLRFGYPGKPLLFEDIDIHVPRGGVTALVGPSGCGKTTLGNILLGLKKPMSGEVSWAGLDPYRDPKGRRRLRQRYQKLHQDPAGAFLPHKTIGRQLMMLGDVTPGLDLARDLPPLLDRLCLHPRLLERLPSAISGGEAQRLALARLLVMKPDLIVADEPTSRLDPIVQKHTIDLLRALADERGLGVILISHDRALVRAACDEVVEIKDMRRSH
jgi:peptide/nickel transport system ATP-binding protein